MTRLRAHDFDFFKVRQLGGYGWIVDRSPAVVVVAIAPDDRVWLARIKRVAARSYAWELPGGGIDGGEREIAAGLRELEEECGLVARGRVRLVAPPFEAAPGMGRFPHHVVVAQKVVPRGRSPVAQAAEGITHVRAVSRAAVRRMIARGAIVAMPTIAALVVSGWLD